MSEFVSYLVEQLSEHWAPVRARRMFGGHGVFRDGVMFGLVADATLYLKVDGESRARFDAAGCEPFVYTKRGKTFAMSYFEAPPEALEDPARLAGWAAVAFAAAARAAAKKGRKRAK